jgi:hypothetical protein
MSGKSNPPTRAYLLRCWQGGEAVAGEGRRWRFSLEELLPKRPRRGFESLDALVGFLEAELAKGDGAAGQASEDGPADELADRLTELVVGRGCSTGSGCPDLRQPGPRSERKES